MPRGHFVTISCNILILCGFNTFLAQQDDRHRSEDTNFLETKRFINQMLMDNKSVLHYEMAWCRLCL